MKSQKTCLSKSSGLVMLAVCVVIAGSQTVPSSAESRIPRPEHPKPQFKRDTWINLNGQWDFVMDPDVAGIKDNWQNKPSKFIRKITVPFLSLIHI